MMKLFIFFIFVLFAGLISASVMNTQERKECEDWQRYAAEARASGLQSEAWQQQQCAAHGILLDY